MADPRIVIIGAGMSGIACGRILADAGLDPIILDKGRSPGGRMSTRRIRDAMSFDHGAQYFTARGAEFRTLVKNAETAGVVARWDAADADSEARFVGLPGMSGLVKYLADSLDIRCGVEVESACRSGSSWILQANTESIETDILVCTAPVVQSRKLLSGHGLGATLEPVSMWPCWALLLGFDKAYEPGFQSRRSDGSLSWVAQNSSKPERSGNCWVVHASPEWSTEHLELETPDAAAHLLSMLRAELGSVPEPSYLAAHRWRYAMVHEALGAPFAKHETLYAGGDWALGSRVECAWISGNAIAKDLLATL